MRGLAIAVLLSLAAAPSPSATASTTFVAMVRTGCATDPDNGPWAVIRIDLSTGDRTVLSGRRDDCALAGAGPDLFGYDAGVADVDADGQIIAMTGGPGSSPTMTLWRVDPATGDRTILSGCVDEACSSTIGAGPQGWPINGHLEPPPAPPTVAALPSWGLPVLAGILVGLTARVLSRPPLINA